MRMRFNRSSQLVLVSAFSLLAAGLVTACGTLTVDFVYVTSAKAAGPNSYGEVDVFEVNSESGKMRQIPTSPFQSGGRNPVAEAVSSDSTTLYVVNQDDNSIVQFTIGSDGKLYPQNTVNTPGVFPLAVTTTSGYLFVADTYEPLPTCSPAPADSLGPPAANSSVSGNYWPLTLPSKPTDVLTPTSVITASSGAYLYVTAFDATAGGGYVFAFAVNSDGTLSAINGSPVRAGTHPSSQASDPSGNFLYVTDFGANQVLSFAVSSGGLSLVSTTPSGSQPSAIVVDTTGKYAYVANSQDSNVSAYSLSNGTLAALGSYTTGTQPVAIGLDPSMNEFLYTANFLGNSVSGFQANAGDGSLLISQSSPYGANANPTAVAAIPHGSQKK
jgi:6-phosphogluconolactonase (cycloisomerase 2 family)